MTITEPALALQNPQPTLARTIRPVKFEDCVALHRLMWSHYDVAQVHERVRRMIRAQEKAYGCAIVVRDRRAGIIAYGQVTQMPRGAEISDLYVHPDWRGKGIGTALIQHLARVAVQHVSRITIGAAESNPRALALYERLGFIPYKTRHIDLGAGIEPVTYLKLDLSPTTPHE